jgi:hypothetical protein
MRASRATKVAIPFPDDPTRCEEVWAEPVVADGLLLYRLLTTSVCVPWTVGDLVRVRQTNEGLTAIALHARGGRSSWMCRWKPEVPPSARVELMQRWAATGASVEGIGGLWFSVAVDLTADERPTEAELELATGAGGPLLVAMLIVR